MCAKGRQIYEIRKIIGERPGTHLAGSTRHKTDKTDDSLSVHLYEATAKAQLYLMIYIDALVTRINYSL